MMNDKKAFYREVGALIRELRRAKRLTQRQFADELEISSQYLSNIERGSAAIPFVVLQMLVAKHHITVKSLSKQLSSAYHLHLARELEPSSK